MILDLFFIRGDSLFERYAIKWAKKTANFRDFCKFSSLELAEGWVCLKKIFKYQQFAYINKLVPFLRELSSSLLSWRDSKIGRFLKHKISDYVIRDDVIGFPDMGTKTFWPAEHDGTTFFRIPWYRKFPKISKNR